MMIDEDTCTLYELYAADWNGGDPTAGSGAIFHLEGPNANDLRPATWTSADAAGLPIFPGLVRWDEVKAGAIQHAIRFTVDCTSRRTCGRHAIRRGATTTGVRRWARGSA